MTPAVVVLQAFSEGAARPGRFPSAPVLQVQFEVGLVPLFFIPVGFCPAVFEYRTQATRDINERTRSSQDR